MADRIKPEDIKPGDWVRHDVWGDGGSIEKVEEVLPPNTFFPNDPPVIVTTHTRLWPADVLEVRRG